jgi:hypothetical protein
MVWDMDLEEWVELKYWMRYAPSIWTKGYSEEFWEKIKNGSTEHYGRYLLNEI